MLTKKRNNCNKHYYTELLYLSSFIDCHIWGLNVGRYLDHVVSSIHHQLLLKFCPITIRHVYPPKELVDGLIQWLVRGQEVA